MTSAAGRSTGGASGARAGGGVRRVEVRRLGRELGGARVDHRVAGPQAERARGRSRSRRSGTPASAGQLPVAEAGPLRGREQRGRLAGRVVAGPGEGLAGRADVRLEGDVAGHLGEEPRGDPGRLLDRRLGDAAAEQAEEPPEPRVGRLEEAARTIGAAVRWAWRVDSQAAPVSSTQRIGSSSASSASSEAARRPPRGSRTPASSSGPRRAARRRPARARGAPCSAPLRRSGRSPSPRRSPSSGCRACGRRSGTCRTGSAAA